MAMRHEINTPAIFVIGVVGAIVLVVLIIGVQAWFLSHEQQEMARYQNDPVLSLAGLNLDQQARLNSYRWVDRDKQLVSLPIDEAMRIMVETRGSFPTTQPQ